MHSCGTCSEAAKRAEEGFSGCGKPRVGHRACACPVADLRARSHNAHISDSVYVAPTSLLRPFLCVRTLSARGDRRNFELPPHNSPQSPILRPLRTSPGKKPLPPRFLPRWAKGTSLLSLPFSPPRTRGRAAAPLHAHATPTFSASSLLPPPTTLPHALWHLRSACAAEQWASVPIYATESSESRSKPVELAKAGQCRNKSGLISDRALDGVMECTRAARNRRQHLTHDLLWRSLSHQAKRLAPPLSSHISTTQWWARPGAVMEM